MVFGEGATEMVIARVYTTHGKVAFCFAVWHGLTSL